MRVSSEMHSRADPFLACSLSPPGCSRTATQGLPPACTGAHHGDHELTLARSWSGSLQGELSMLWSYNPSAKGFEAGTPEFFSEELNGLGGGITWAWDPALCDKLLPQFSEKDSSGPGSNLVTCEGVKAATVSVRQVGGLTFTVALAGPPPSPPSPSPPIATLALTPHLPPSPLTVTFHPHPHPHPSPPHLTLTPTPHPHPDPCLR